ncbi:hypothetical protein [Rubrivirga sp.]|uniref:hypothetical protein n=1 Tax=Rubrivirga sp. TaxID=1885344 RepID=UPI003B5225F6
MSHGLARSAALLTVLAVLLARGLALTPGDLRIAGAAGLVVYGVLTLGRPLLRRLLTHPSDD